MTDDYGSSGSNLSNKNGSPKKTGPAPPAPKMCFCFGRRA